MSQPQTGQAEHKQGDLVDVELRLIADLGQLFVVRALAATIAIRQDFALDAVEDVKLAVDEICSTLVPRAAEGEQLSCRFTASDGRISVTASVVSDRAAPVDQETFGWRVLTTLTEQASSSVTPRDEGGYQVVIEVSQS
ncbi:MAG TPA: anti-sigma factor [Pseudonocardiaceae bacterium]|nr:anti-sigma factor [Pseudonocardiaceae bacterium]